VRGLPVKRLVFSFALFLVFLPAFANAAVTAVNVTDVSTNGTIIVGNPTSLGWNANSTNVTLVLNVSIIGSTTPHTVNVTWYLPYGMQPANGAAACNGTGFRTSSVNFQNDRVACGVKYTIANATYTNLSVVVNANISAFRTFNRSNGLEEFTDFWANVSGNATSDAANDTEWKTWYGNNYYINPRPDFIFDTTNGSNVIAYVTTWKQTDVGYYVSAPLMTFNSDTHMPQAGNASYADVMYFDKSMMERPSYMRMYSYNLTFHVMMNGTSARFTIRSINTTATEGATPSQALVPLLTYNQTQTDFVGNVTFNMTMSTPSPTGFNIWYNNSNSNYTRLTASEAAALGFNINFLGGQNQNSMGIFLVNITNSSWNNTDFAVLLTVLNQTAGGFVPLSPIYVVNQSFTGLDFSHGPKFGENVSMNYVASLNNSMANFTFNNVSVRFTIPLNVTGFNTSNANDNFTHTMSTGGAFSAWNSTGWNASAAANYSRCLNMSDPNPNSPSNGFNITACFQVLDIQLASATYNRWYPGSANSNITLNFSANVSFPVMQEANNTPGTAGSTNYYNATFSPSMRSSLNLTDKVPGIADAGCAGTTLTLDGATLTCGTNYTIGSLTLGDVSSGTHSVSVSYSIAPGSSPSGGGGGSSCSGDSSCASGYYCSSNGYCTAPSCASNGMCDIGCARAGLSDPDCPTATATPTAAPTATITPTATATAVAPTATAAPTIKPTPKPTAPAIGKKVTAAQVASQMIKVNALLAQARTAKADVGPAERLINLAQNAMGSGDYNTALGYANQAEAELSNSIATMQALQSRQAGGFDSLLLAVVVVLVLAGGYYYFFMRKKRKGL